MRFLKDRYSVHFINFICLSTRLVHGKRGGISALQGHSFFTTSTDHENGTAKIGIEDLLGMNRTEHSDGFFESGTEEKMDKFIGHLVHVLYACKGEVLN